MFYFLVCVCVGGGGGAIRIINDPISFSSAGSRQPGLHCCLSGKPERGGHRLLLPHQKVLHTHIKIIMIIITTIITIDITIIKVQQKVLHTHEKFTWNFCVRIHQYFNFLDPLNIGVVAGVLSLRARQTSAKPPFRSTSASTKKLRTGQNK